jgi:hypothetical protein
MIRSRPGRVIGLSLKVRMSPRVEIMYFLIFNLFLKCVTSDKRGWGYAHIWEMGVSMALYGDATTTRVFGLTKTDHSILLIWYVRLWVATVTGLIVLLLLFDGV